MPKLYLAETMTIDSLKRQWMKVIYELDVEAYVENILLNILRKFKRKDFQIKYVQNEDYFCVKIGHLKISSVDTNFNYEDIKISFLNSLTWKYTKSKRNNYFKILIFAKILDNYKNSDSELNYFEYTDKYFIQKVKINTTISIQNKKYLI